MQQIDTDNQNFLINNCFLLIFPYKQVQHKQKIIIEWLFENRLLEVFQTFLRSAEFYFF
jgi:hypothetical protein